MKPVRLKVPAYSKFHIDARNEQAAYFANPWHFHEELELTFIIKSEGTKFIGDHISTFEPGEIILLGSQLPHYWRNAPSYYHNIDQEAAKAVVIRFNKDYAGTEFLKIPPMQPVLDLLDNAKRGILIKPNDLQLQQKLIDFVTLNDGQKTVALTDILLSIATEKSYTYLCSIGYAHQYKSNDIEKIDTVYNHVLNHFKSDLSVKEVARKCNMNTAAFCRYFKKKTGKTFKDFMNEIRLGNATKLLVKGDLTMAEIAFESGFNTPSYFNRLFKKTKGITPTAYRSNYTTKHEN